MIFHHCEFTVNCTGNDHRGAVFRIDRAVRRNDFHMQRRDKGISHGLFPFLHLFSLFDRFVNGAYEIECAFRQVVVLTFEDFLEAANRFFQRNVFAGLAGELFCYEERLRQESLDLSCTGYDDFIFIGEFFHAEDGDDVLQFFVALQNGLYAAGHLVVFFAEDVRVKNTAGGVQRIDCRVNAQFCDGTVQNRGRIEVGGIRLPEPGR